MAWHQPGGKPLSEPMISRFMTQICITQPQGVKQLSNHSWTRNSHDYLIYLMIWYVHYVCSVPHNFSINLGNLVHQIPQCHAIFRHFNSPVMHLIPCICVNIVLKFLFIVNILVINVAKLLPVRGSLSTTDSLSVSCAEWTIHPNIITSLGWLKLEAP